MCSLMNLRPVNLKQPQHSLSDQDIVHLVLTKNDVQEESDDES